MPYKLTDPTDPHSPVYQTLPCFYCERPVAMDGTEFRLVTGDLRTLICDVCRAHHDYPRDKWPQYRCCAGRRS